MAVSMKALISGKTIVETQVEAILFGAIRQKKTKDGNIATN